MSKFSKYESSFGQVFVELYIEQTQKVWFFGSECTVDLYILIIFSLLEKIMDEFSFAACFLSIDQERCIWS